ncbi:Protein-tyrosine phosphatase [Teladorsagia circumcincta]|uniref:Protein-tyrosine phosphatase n=1 Tax=Teladorsagia circumcincta TaxID=45464 RepID=A0A2G9UJL7_TELCI|nr:Protein-tyrosine phosphatase [Teladorsagia circumcincta]
MTVIRAVMKKNAAMTPAYVKVFVEETMRKGVQGLIAEFRGMKRGNDFSKMTEFVAQIPEGRNRYKDVGCLDHRRVIVKIGNVSYIHANYVSTPNNSKRFICTQAPLPKTCSEFWCMVVQEKSKSILMLCNFTEQNTKKCAVYFPMQAGQRLTFDGDVQVLCKKQEQVPHVLSRCQSSQDYHLMQVPDCQTHVHLQKKDLLVDSKTVFYSNIANEDTSENEHKNIEDIISDEKDHIRCTAPSERD